MIMELSLKPIGEYSYTWAEGFAFTNKPMREEGMRQIDWETVKSIIDSNEFERVEIGLAEDYYQTHVVIFKNNELIIKENDGAGFYGCSRWATPAIKLTKSGDTGLFECWISGEEKGFPKWLTERARVIDTYDWDDDEDEDEPKFA